MRLLNITIHNNFLHCTIPCFKGKGMIFCNFCQLYSIMLQYCTGQQLPCKCISLYSSLIISVAKLHCNVPVCPNHPFPVDGRRTHDYDFCYFVFSYFGCTTTQAKEILLDTSPPVVWPLSAGEPTNANLSQERTIVLQYSNSPQS